VGVMIAWRWFASIGVFAIWAGTVPATSATVQSASVRRLLDGRQLFRSYCAACHGEDAKGHGPAAPALKAPPPDLTLIASRNRGVFPRARIVDYVANGDSTIAAHGSKEMPVWGPDFAALVAGANQPVNDRIDAVVEYVQSIQTEK
jgi:mono/diheme cytochrome c family protein